MAAEAALGAFLSVLFEKLATGDVLNFARRRKLLSQLQNWATNLRAIKLVLGDAENCAMGIRVGDGGSRDRDSAGISLWLDDLKDLAYDLEDLLDEFAAEEALELSLSKLMRSVLLPCSALFTCKTRFKVDDIDGRLNDIMKRKELLRLAMDIGAPRVFGQWATRPPSTCLADSSIFGRDDDVKSILEALKKDGSVDNDNLSMIFIVGMGGLGKTTVAQVVYNDETVQASFPARAWACVSDVFDELSITRTILSSVSKTHSHEGKDLSALQEELKRALSGKKFLIVLDDVWNEVYERWTLLRKPFVSSGAKGSKIIVTTRNKPVVSIMKSQTSTEFSLDALSDKDSLALLARHALEADDFEERYSYLKPAAEKIVEKCGRLPLATKTLGGLLRSTDALSDWEHIAETKIWDLERAGSIPQALNLSYVYLPSELKRCFAYCAVFPKDCEFDMESLILSWMAEGLLGKERMHDLGMKYFQELLDRSFFQPSNSNSNSNSSGEKSGFVMHDLMNDLAISKAGTSCLSLREGLLHPNMCPEKVRHLSLIQGEFDVSGRFEGFDRLKRLRTFLSLFHEVSYFTNRVTVQEIDNAFRHAKHLRTFSLHHYSISEVPNCVGIMKHLRFLTLSGNDIQFLPKSMSALCNLQTLVLKDCLKLVELPSWIGLWKHLRYLNISGSQIRFLPTSMSTLYNLETLILKDCSQLEELPGWFEKLINLRCLDISGTDRLRKMPRGMNDLIKLETLPKFIVGKGPDGLRLSELKEMQFLKGEISLRGLRNVVDVGDAKDAALAAKRGLTCLFFSWEHKEDEGIYASASRTDDAASETEVLEWLRPHDRIKNITIEGYGGTKFPSWIGSISFILLEKVTLRNCRSTENLPSLGQLPLLKKLSVVGMDAVRSVGQEFYGDVAEPFPSLKTLSFIDMHAWERWFFFTAVGQGEHCLQFPCLSKLRLQKCSKLVIEKWPDQLPSLVEMVIEECPLLETPDNTCINLPSLEEGEFG